MHIVIVSFQQIISFFVAELWQKLFLVKNSKFTCRSLCTATFPLIKFFIAAELKYESVGDGVVALLTTLYLWLAWADHPHTVLSWTASVSVSAACYAKYMYICT